MNHEGPFTSHPRASELQLTAVGRRLPKCSLTQQKTLLRAFCHVSPSNEVGSHVVWLFSGCAGSRKGMCT